MQHAVTHLLFACVTMGGLECTVQRLMEAADTLGIVPALEWAGVLQAAAKRNDAETCDALLRHGTLHEVDSGVVETQKNDWCSRQCV